MDLLSGSVDLLAKVMDTSARRHDVLAANIANVNTPNYKAREVKFDAEFRQALVNDGREAALAVQPEVVEDAQAPVKADGNSVHLEKELGSVQKNALLFSVYGTLLQAKLQSLKAAISGSAR